MTTRKHPEWKTIPEFTLFEAHPPTKKYPHGMFRRRGKLRLLKLIFLSPRRSPIIYISWANGRSTNRTTKSLLEQTFDEQIAEHKTHREKIRQGVKYFSVKAVAEAIWEELQIYPYDERGGGGDGSRK